MDRGWDQNLGTQQKQFVYLPLMHSERIADQRLSLCKMAALRSPTILDFAKDHYRMIARFGRFPHRNAPLGRRSTQTELNAIEAGNAW